MDLTQGPGFTFDWSFPGAFLWGLLVLISFVGWGQTIGCWLVTPGQGEQDWGWGLAAAWGMAAFLVLAGPLLMLSLFSTTFVASFLLVGLMSVAWHFHFLCKRSLCAWPGNRGLKALLAAVLFLVTLTYGGAVAEHGYNPCDDFAAYFAHVKMLLDTGTLSDPFSYRLITALGGEQTLCTLVLAFFPWKYAHLLDAGIAMLMVLGLIQGIVRGGDWKAWIARIILVLLALTFPMPRINITSELTGVVLFMALFFSFDLVSTRRCVGWRSALLLGGLVMATGTLRGNYIFAVAFISLCFIGWRLREDWPDRRTVIRDSTMTFVATLVFLAPWWIVTYRSSGSFLFPLVKGTLQQGFDNFSQHLPLLDTLQFVLGFFSSTTYLLLFLPVCFVQGWPRARTLLILAGAVLFISGLFLSQYTLGDYPTMYRYLTPMGVPFGFYSIGVVAQQLAAASPFRGPVFSAVRAIFAMILAMSALCFQSLEFWNISNHNLALIQWAMNARYEISNYGLPVSTDDARRDYAEAFATIPPGTKAMIALDYPFLVDYRSHSIVGIDIPGEASPAPGLPYFSGPESVKKYLLAQGIHYVAHVPFAFSDYLYSRDREKANLVGPVPVYQLYARYELDFLDNVDQLAKSNRILYDSPTIRVIALGD